LVFGIVPRDGSGDELRCDARLLEPPRDPLAAPAVQRAPVLGEARGVAGVVEVALVGQHRDRALDRRCVELAPAQVPAQLGDRAVAPAELAVRELERRLQSRLVFHRLAYATASTCTGPAPFVSAPSIGVTRSREIPSAS